MDSTQAHTHTHTDAHRVDGSVSKGRIHQFFGEHQTIHFSRWKQTHRASEYDFVLSFTQHALCTAVGVSCSAAYSRVIAQHHFHLHLLSKITDGAFSAAWMIFDGSVRQPTQSDSSIDSPEWKEKPTSKLKKGNSSSSSNTNNERQRTRETEKWSVATYKTHWYSNCQKFGVCLTAKTVCKCKIY